MNLFVRSQLSLMMFLQFFIWGAWFVTMGPFLQNNLQASDTQIGLAYMSQAWGAIIAPFFVGLFADRFINAERILGGLHIIGAVLLFMLARAESLGLFTPLVYLYMILYMPTLALVNSVSFNQMEDPARQFASVRVLGTIGWIVAGLAISFVFDWDSASAISAGMLENTFLMAAVAAAVLGLLSFTLPKTPPRIPREEKVTLGDIVGLDAIRLLKDRNFAVFFASSVLISIPLAFYYQHTNQFLTEIQVDNPTGKMTIGQGSEVLFMLLLPLFLKRFGIKITLLVGMAAWALRYVMFAYGNAGELAYMLLIGIALHGICYDFFFVSGQIYTDHKAGEKHKSAAQGMITLATYGLGMLIGFWAAGMITESQVTGPGMHDWKTVWLIPAAFAAAILVFFALFFKPQKMEKELKEEVAPADVNAPAPETRV